MGGPGTPPGGPGGEPGGPPGFGGPGGFGRDSAISKAMSDLLAAAADAKAPPDELKNKLAAVRAARQKARDNLEAAKKDLLELLSPDQEAVLVALGYLE
jgi:hypothetical protein